MKNENQFATKKDLKSVEKNIKKDMEKIFIAQTKTILKAVDFSIGNTRKELGHKITQNTNKIDKILEQQDGIVKQLTDLQTESKMSSAAYKRHDDQIQGHEERINNLEIKIQPVNYKNL